MLLYIIMDIVENKTIDNNDNNIQQPFTEEELEKSNIIDASRDYRQELLDKYKDYEPEDYEGIDDFVEDEDKVALIRYCDHIIKINFKEYPSNMEEVLVKKMYYDVIKTMNKEDYLEEKRQINQLTPIEKELQKIKDEENLEYAIKDFKKE